MKKDLIKKEAVSLVYILLAGIVILKILFYNEDFPTILRTLLAFFWLFILPGFSLMYYWEDKLNFMERFLIGVAVSAAIIGTCSYYFGLIGLNIKYHGILLPLLLLTIGSIIIIKNK
ncbi:MAG: hypothetical protein QF362_05145 [Candidatus Woesearchaeota archaeon]|jgi:uncharacterized membrane protein|nr:hypothetical protein [Candidatus Woesearchaeota archaeon]|tara:strand:+ start:485 stop:835 length:351 start_codon:yes stop_codon:yes gene_type:complete